MTIENFSLIILILTIFISSGCVEQKSNTSELSQVSLVDAAGSLVENITRRIKDKARKIEERQLINSSNSAFKIKVESISSNILNRKSVELLNLYLSS